MRARFSITEVGLISPGTNNSTLSSGLLGAGLHGPAAIGLLGGLGYGLKVGLAMIGSRDKGMISGREAPHSTK